VCVFILFARILVTAAVLLLALRCHIAVDAGSLFDAVDLEDRGGRA
jgi:hypothetical protein